MKTRDTQGSFIILIWTLIAKVQRLTAAPCVPIYPRADVVTGLLLCPLIGRCMLRRRAEEGRLSQQVFRYSSSQSEQPSYASSMLSRVQR